MIKQVFVFFVIWSCCISVMAQHVAPFVLDRSNEHSFILAREGYTAAIWVDEHDDKGVIRAANDLKKDMQQVFDRDVTLGHDSLSPYLIIVGTIGNSRLIDQLIQDGKIDIQSIQGNWESALIQVVEQPLDGVDRALVIAGSDRRGTIFGIYELSQQMGVSPWYYWADVPITKKEQLHVAAGRYILESPKVKYRGIFINDEAPALSGWAYATFGGFNHQFYEKVFELILRLRGNFLWPAMWGNAFFDDDPTNGVLANEYGIVISTSHHEPMGRAHAEWSRYGSGPWNYTKNQTHLQEFWRSGMDRMKTFETLVTVGMRGDGDEPMSDEQNIGLLSKIVQDQRHIIEQITGKRKEEVPQVWALYKEVQDYYDQGMRVDDDITLLLCDDNWGNVRKLPDLDAPERRGGYGMYYHFDYVGGPRNYKWINVSPIQRVWEQMNLTYAHGVDRIWVVNVGDIKPMEYPISFFLDMAWNPEKWNADNLLDHTVSWCAEQFGEQYAEESARLITLYTKYNRRVTPELLNDTTYSLENYDEFGRVVQAYKDLALDAFRLYNQIPDKTKDAFDQLVLFPINACSNLYELYYAVAKNKQLIAQSNPQANDWADAVERAFVRDHELSEHYHTNISAGKWPHIMDQIRIGYTSWQQPDQAIQPEVKRLETISPAQGKFVEEDGYIAMEAAHYTSKSESNAYWQVIPFMGKTLSAVTTMPATIAPDENTYLEYTVETSSYGKFDIHVLLSPTLNYNANEGLCYAVSVDGGEEQIVNFNAEYDVATMEKWQANSIIVSTTTHDFGQAGLYKIRWRALHPGVILQRLIIDTGGLKKSYLGPPESRLITK